MNNTPPLCQQSDGPKGLTFSKATEILWDCAWEAVVLAFLVQLMGGIVFGLVSGLWREMTPSLPSGLGRHPIAEADSASPADFTFFHQHRFALLFAVLFVGKSWGRLARYSGNEDHRNVAARLKRVSRRVSEQWFSLVVGNAFTAFVAVMVLRFTQEFSLTQLVWQLLGDLVRPVIQTISSFVPGAGLMESLVGWYNDNQFKFAFWLLYSAAICDDLGLPNYKSLGRFLWRRYAKPEEPAARSKAPNLKS